MTIAKWFPRFGNGDSFRAESSRCETPHLADVDSEVNGRGTEDGAEVAEEPPGRNLQLAWAATDVSNVSVVVVVVIAVGVIRIELVVPEFGWYLDVAATVAEADAVATVAGLAADDVGVDDLAADRVGRAEMCRDAHMILGEHSLDSRRFGSPALES